MPTKSDSGVRDQVWDQLRAVALPDSRFHFDFAPMHPDFIGSAEASERLLAAMPAPIDVAFSVPDGALRSGREQLLRRGTRIVVSTYCMRRGFRLLDPARIAAVDYAFASTLDGLDRFGSPLTLTELADLGRMDLVVTGAAAVSPNGVRFGRSHQYFDIEWGVLAELGLVDERTPVAVVIHDVQLTGDKLSPMPGEAVPDMIATPTRLVRVSDRPKRPPGVDWSGIEAAEIEQIPPLIELQRARGLRP